MACIPFLGIPVPDSVLNGLGETTAGTAENFGNAAMQLAGNPAILVGGIILVAAAVVIFFFLKKIIINGMLLELENTENTLMFP